MKQTVNGIILILLVILVLGFVPQFIEFIYKKEGFVFTVTDFSKHDLLSFYGSFLTFIGTVLLGAITIYQNYVFKRENEQSQKRLESINNKMMKAQQAHYMPVLDITIRSIELKKDHITRENFTNEISKCKNNGMNEIYNPEEYISPTMSTNYNILFDDNMLNNSTKETFDLLLFRMNLKNIGTSTIRKVFLRGASIIGMKVGAKGNVRGILLKEQFVFNGEFQFWLSVIVEDTELKDILTNLFVIEFTFLLLTLDDRVFIYQMRLSNKNGLIETDASCSEALDEDERYNWIKIQRGF